MAVVYATLIIKGKKNYADVPDRIKEQVKQVLVDLDCGDLIAEWPQDRVSSFGVWNYTPEHKTAL